GSSVRIGTVVLPVGKDAYSASKARRQEAAASRDRPAKSVAGRNAGILCAKEVSMPADPRKLLDCVTSLEGLELVNRLVDVLGAAVKASRAAVGAGLLPSDLQIGGAE